MMGALMKVCCGENIKYRHTITGKLWILMPVTTFVVSLMIGKNDYMGEWKWISVIAFGIMYMLSEYATFSAANMAAFDKVNIPELGMIPAGAMISLIGMGIGMIIRKRRK